MLKKLLKVAPVLFFWLVFILIVFNVDYPISIAQATFGQLTAFFVPLFIAIFLSINLMIKSLYSSTIIGLGIILLLILKALGILSVVTTTITLLAIFFLTYKDNMPKLSNLFRRKRR